MGIKIGLALSIVATALSACGGGGSNSGAGVAPAPQPVLSAIPEGLYSGTRTIVFSGPRVDDTPQELEFVLNVTGTIEGQQQVSIRYSRWSGSSAIVTPGNTFSIPSGQYVVDSPSSFGRCTSEKVVEGTFVEGSATGTESGVVTCERVSEPIRLEGTFSVSFTGTAKISAPVNSSAILSEEF